MPHQRIAKAFEKKFGKKPELLVRAPGRINLIGEHTDYNEGFVLPAAVDKAVYFCLSPTSSEYINLFAADLNEEFSISLNDLKKTEISWVNYLIGVIAELKKSGADFRNGFDLAFGGDVPLGAGMSSSAAIESGMGTALNVLYNLQKSELELALTAQQAEHNFAGVRCGIMDMYASVFGKENQLIKLDCRNFTHEYLPFDFEGISVILFNTGVKHNLAESAYNKRREECEAGVKALNVAFGKIKSLRDATPEQLEQIKHQLEEKVYDRCRFILSETERMMKATDFLLRGMLKEFGQLMFETHNGLRDQYEVSCEELDFLVEEAKENKAVSGARMMGGGFGGCTINLVKKEAEQEVINQIKNRYKERFGFEPEHYIVSITDGCSVIND
jgi:galactokinase